MQPTGKQFEDAIATLQRGGIVAYPTETFYGLAVDPCNDKAIASLYTLKERDLSKPLSLIVPDIDCLLRYVRNVPKLYKVLIDTFWPGPLSLVFPASSQLSSQLCGDGDTIAIRISSHPVANALCRQFGCGITATSANISGRPALIDSDSVSVELADRVDFILNGGEVPGGQGSTIVEENNGKVCIVRQGVITKAEIAGVLRKNRYLIIN